MSEELEHAHARPSVILRRRIGFNSSYLITYDSGCLVVYLLSGTL
jgi:hypothetical protein